MNRLSDELLRQADIELSGGLPNPFIRHVLYFASCDVPLDEILKRARIAHSWYKAHAATGPLPSRTNSSATTSSVRSSRIGTGPGPSSSRTSLSFDSSYDRAAWPPIPEETSPVVSDTLPLRQGSQQVYRASKALLGKLNTATDLSGPFRRTSCTSDTQCSRNTVKTYHCPWCQTGCGRPGELREHFKHHCGSQNAFVCSKCGTGAQSKKRAKKLLKCSGPCQHNLQEYVLDYDRRAFACPGCECVSSSLEDHLTHFLDCCKGLGHIGPEQRIRQIRSLLSSNHLRHRVGNIWFKLGLVGVVETIDDLSWTFDKPSSATKIVEQLEYGERNVADGMPNFGITSARIDGHLARLISKGLPSKPDPVQSDSTAVCGQPWAPKQSLMTVPSPIHGSGSSPLFDAMRCDSPRPLPPEETYCNERDGNSQYSEPYSMSQEVSRPLFGEQSRQFDCNNQIQHSITAPDLPGPPLPPKIPSLPQVDADMMEFDNNAFPFDSWPQVWPVNPDFIPGTPVGYDNRKAFNGRDGTLMQIL